MDNQGSLKLTSIPGQELNRHGSVHLCQRCGWPFPNPHPSARHRRSHKKICGRIEGYKIDSKENPHSDFSEDDDDLKPPSPNHVKNTTIETGSGSGSIGSNTSDYEVFSNAIQEVSNAEPNLGIAEQLGNVRESVPIITILDKESVATESTVAPEDVTVPPSGLMVTEGDSRDGEKNFEKKLPTSPLESEKEKNEEEFIVEVKNENNSDLVISDELGSSEDKTRIDSEKFDSVSLVAPMKEDGDKQVNPGSDIDSSDSQNPRDVNLLEVDDLVKDSFSFPPLDQVKNNSTEKEEEAEKIKTGENQMIKDSVEKCVEVEDKHDGEIDDESLSRRESGVVSIDSLGQTESLEGNMGSVSDAEELSNLSEAMAKKPDPNEGHHDSEKKNTFDPPSSMTLVEPENEEITEKVKNTATPLESLLDEPKTENKQKEIIPQEKLTKSDGDLVTEVNFDDGDSKNKTEKEKEDGVSIDSLSQTESLEGNLGDVSGLSVLTEALAKKNNSNEGHRDFEKTDTFEPSSPTIPAKPKKEESKNIQNEIISQENFAKNNGEIVTAVKSVLSPDSVEIEAEDRSEIRTEKRKVKKRSFWSPFGCCSSVH